MTPMRGMRPGRVHAPGRAHTLHVVKKAVTPQNAYARATACLCDYPVAYRELDFDVCRMCSRRIP